MLFPGFYSFISLVREHSGIDVVSLWNLLVSILFLLAANIIIDRPFYVHILLLPVYIFVLLDCFTIYLFDARMTSGLIWVGLSNLEEFYEFYHTYQIFLIPGVLVFLVFYIFCLFFIRNFKWYWRWKTKLMIIFIFCSTYLSAIVYQYLKTNNIETAFEDIIEHDLSIPAGILSQSYIVYQQRNGFQNIDREQITLGAYKKVNSKLPEIYVMVIGESSRKQNWSLYGYKRKTNALLETQENIVVFDSVISNWPLTQMAVPLMLTDSTIIQNRGFKHNEDILNRPSILHAFRDAGFKTLWLTNQPFDRFAGNINYLANDADIVVYLTNKYDYSLIELLQEQIKIEGFKKNIFVVLHMKGSHFEYKRRYPKEFNKFKTKSVSGRKSEIVNTYDNTILYTDYVLFSLIEYLKSLNAISAMFYVSDHGENLYDDEKGLFGHNFSNEYDLSIPMIMWGSDIYKQIFSQKWKYGMQNHHKKADFCNVFYTVIDMAGITYPGMKESFSLVNSKYREHTRYFYNQRKNLLSATIEK